MKKLTRGFTLVELLVVISIITLLSSIVLTAVSSARLKARDAKRAEEMGQIYRALILFYDKYGCLPLTAGTTCVGAIGYSEANGGGWDWSSQGGFMQFLETDGFLSKVPVDSVNNAPGSGLIPVNTFNYRYYCYDVGSQSRGLHLAYWKEQGDQYVIVNNTTMINVNNGMPWADDTYICK